jgi:predicted nucleotidyltransferase component of viral defense system
MNDAIKKMLESYPLLTKDDQRNALREVLQRLALLGLWRSKFFEHAAFYGGTALRILHQLNRFSEDLDFSLLAVNPDFSLAPYGKSLCRELSSFGFDVRFETHRRGKSAIESAFLKTDTLLEEIIIGPAMSGIATTGSEKILKIKLEVDTTPPAGFTTETKTLLQPLPFAVKVYSLPDLFAGKMHALLCRNWKNRVKGRDWFDLVWYISFYPQLNLSHLEARMRHSGHWTNKISMTSQDLQERLHATIDQLDVKSARDEAIRFVNDRSVFTLWSRDFFHEIVQQIKVLSP